MADNLEDLDELGKTLSYLFGPPIEPFEGGLLWTAPPQDKPKTEEPVTD